VRLLAAKAPEQIVTFSLQCASRLLTLAGSNHVETSLQQALTQLVPAMELGQKPVAMVIPASRGAVSTVTLHALMPPATAACVHSRCSKQLGGVPVSLPGEGPVVAHLHTRAGGPAEPLYLFVLSTITRYLRPTLREFLQQQRTRFFHGMHLVWLGVVNAQGTAVTERLDSVGASLPDCPLPFSAPPYAVVGLAHGGQRVLGRQPVVVSYAGLETEVFSFKRISNRLGTRGTASVEQPAPQSPPPVSTPAPTPAPPPPPVVGSQPPPPPAAAPPQPQSAQQTPRQQRIPRQPRRTQQPAAPRATSAPPARSTSPLIPPACAPSTAGPQAGSQPRVRAARSQPGTRTAATTPARRPAASPASSEHSPARRGAKQPRTNPPSSSSPDTTPPASVRAPAPRRTRPQQAARRTRLPVAAPRRPSRGQGVAWVPVSQFLQYGGASSGFQSEEEYGFTSGDYDQGWG
jgi:hypothetical protein